MPILNLLRPIALIVILFWLFTDEPSAAGFEPLSNIKDSALARAREAAPSDAKLAVGRLDERLRLPECGTPLASQLQSDTGGAMSIEVRCDTAGWKLFVPVSIDVQVPVLVASRPLSRGQTLGLTDVEVQRRDRGSVGAAWLSSPDQLKGLELSRSLPAGAVLAPNALIATRVVRRGQSVTLVGESGGFQVRAEGKALADAAAGEQVRVENLGSRKIVQGKARPDGSVLISL